MGANADPSGPLGGPHRHPSPVAAAPQHGVAANTAAALRHDPGLAVRWSPEEQAVLDEGLAKYVADAAIVRYAKIAMSLPDKTVRDVALRCRWMAKKESSKKRKEEIAKKSKEKKERVGDSSTKGPAHLVARPNVPSYSLPVLPMEDDDVSYKAIGGPTGQLLEHNAQILNQIYANISNMQFICLVQDLRGEGNREGNGNALGWSRRLLERRSHAEGGAEDAGRWSLGGADWMRSAREGARRKAVGRREARTGGAAYGRGRGGGSAEDAGRWSPGAVDWRCSERGKSTGGTLSAREEAC